MLQQPSERAFLGWCSRVAGVSFLVKSTNIADSNCVQVVVFDVCPNRVQWSSVLNTPVKVYHVMVTDAAVTLFAVPFINVSCVEICPALCRGAVNNDCIKVSHNYWYLGSGSSTTMARTTFLTLLP